MERLLGAVIAQPKRFSATFYFGIRSLAAPAPRLNYGSRDDRVFSPGDRSPRDEGAAFS